MLSLIVTSYAVFGWRLWEASPFLKENEGVDLEKGDRAVKVGGVRERKLWLECITRENKKNII